MKISKPPMRKARIEIIPMIDTIFFLLVFFMFTSLSMVKMNGLNIDLPKSAPPQPNGDSANGEGGKTVVTVTAGGDYYVGTTKIDAANLEKQLQEAVTANPKGVVIVNVSKQQTTQALINIMDTVGKLTLPSGQPVPALIATEPVDAHGNAVSPLPSSPAVSTPVAGAAAVSAPTPVAPLPEPPVAAAPLTAAPVGAP